MARDDIREVRKELRDLRKRVQMRPIVTTGTHVPSIGVLTEFGGNTIVTLNATPIRGIKKSTLNVVEVPALAPTVGASYADGLGYASLNFRGNLYPVWVAIQANGVSGSPLSYPVNFICRTLLSTTVAVTASSERATVYLPYVF